MTQSRQKPTLRVLVEVGVLWVAANAGYFIIFPSFGISLSYNDSPLIFTVYFLCWFSVALFTLQDELTSLAADNRLWTYAAACTALGALIAYLLYTLSLAPQLVGKSLVPYTDILFATPWYFLPKSAEVFLQQTLIAALVLALYRQYGSLFKTAAMYTLTFGAVHALVYALNDAPTEYGTIITLGAIASGAIFPYLIVRVRNGFLYAIFIHLLFYVLLALLVHTVPPPGYGG